MHGKTELAASTEPPASAARNAQDTALKPTTVIRRQLRAARAELTAQQRQSASRAICDWLAQPGPDGWHRYLGQEPKRPAIIAAFWPLAQEPDLRPLLLEWIEQGYQVALPAVVRAASPLRFRRWHPAAPMQTDSYGIPTPAGGLCLPDVLLVPTLGFSAHGDRIGYGGGYYDRTLAALEEAGHPHLAIGVAFECGRLPPQDHYVPAPHDIPLAAVVTEAGWTRALG